MAIFIALIFQVLFVLFAMAVNIALVVHDKINLQNAADLAAYYAAERQAEFLNVIAHENYMIRQSWKLLAWRYRALGSSGVQTPNRHPIYSGSVAEAPFMFNTTDPDPTVCIIHAANWLNVDPLESLCKRPQVNIPPLPVVPVIAGFLPFNIVFSRLAARLRNQQSSNCSVFGAYNWWFAAASLQAFREDQRNRKQIIFSLAQHLASSNEGDFKDLNGGSVKEGAYKTLSKNLTFTNANSLVSFKVLNSLEGISREKWLSEVQIAPMTRYMDPQEGAGCTASGNGRPVSMLPERAPARDLLMKDLNSGGLGLADLAQWSTGGAGYLATSDYQFSLGVEKNPWVVAYMGVQVETAPRQIFFPFGSSIQMVARSFAKPFGGKIGPWYGSRWPKGSDRSTGAETDPLGPPRFAAGGIMNSPNDPKRLPNYSRFPGDRLGLRSQLALNALNGLAGLQSPNDVFQHIWKPIAPGGYNDILAFDTFSNIAPPIRRLEIAAIAPDLFDISYYSIEPNFGLHYLPKLKAHRNLFGIPSNVVIRGDLGTPELLPDKVFSVKDQIEVAEGASPVIPRKPESFFFVRNKSHLLTSWTTGDLAYDFTSFPSQRFGQCGFPDDGYQDVYKIPGSCLARGGRSGYSIKLVSRDYLLSSEHPNGGGGEGSGPILNPPPSNLGW